MTSPLAPSIARLVELGTLERGLDDGARGAFRAGALAARARGELTRAQAETLAALIGAEPLDAAA